MTTRDFKRLIQDRMQRTGEPYNVARRKLEQRRDELHTSSGSPKTVAFVDDLGGTFTRTFLGLRDANIRVVGGVLVQAENEPTFFGLAKSGVTRESQVRRELRGRAVGRVRASSLAAASLDDFKADLGIAVVPSESDDGFFIAHASANESKCADVSGGPPGGRGELAGQVAMTILRQVIAGQPLFGTRTMTLTVTPQKTERGGLIGQIVRTEVNLSVGITYLRVKFAPGSDEANLEVPAWPLNVYQLGDYVEVVPRGDEAQVTTLNVEHRADHHDRRTLHISAFGTSAQSPLAWTPALAKATAE